MLILVFNLSSSSSSYYLFGVLTITPIPIMQITTPTLNIARSWGVKY